MIVRVLSIFAGVLVWLGQAATAAEISYHPRSTPKRADTVVASFSGKPLLRMGDVDQSLSIFYFNVARDIHRRQVEGMRAFLGAQLLAWEAQKQRKTIEELLQTDGKGLAREAYVGKLWREAKIEIKLPEPELPQVIVNERTTSPVLGLTDGPANVIEFCAFTNPACRDMWKTLGELVKKHGWKVRIVHRDYPQDPLSMTAAIAARCAQQQGKFWRYHGVLYENQNKLDAESLKGYARALNLDAGKFDGCLDKREPAQEIQHDIDEGKAIGLSSVPALFVNTIYFPGDLPQEKLAHLVESEVGRVERK
ncbi:MAG: DsbA family protein [Candidatus Binatia bacterium]